MAFLVRSRRFDSVLDGRCFVCERGSGGDSFFSSMYRVISLYEVVISFSLRWFTLCRVGLGSAFRVRFVSGVGVFSACRLR